MELVKIFSHSVGSCFFRLMVSFVLQTRFSSKRSDLLSVDLSAYTMDVLFRKSTHVPVHSRQLPTWSCINFSVSGFKLTYFIPLGVRWSFEGGGVCLFVCFVLLCFEIIRVQNYLLSFTFRNPV